VKNSLTKLKVDICIITYARPESLELLLHSLSRLRFLKMPQPDLRVVIVDNDPSQTAREVVAGFAGPAWLDHRYFVEPKRGIPQARNTSIAHMRRDADYAAFIDDDEYADENWLDELLWVATEYGADIVIGPVIPKFLMHPPSWILDGRYYERMRHATGTILDYGRTGNALVGRTVFQRFKESGMPYFDERLALMGGSDTLFFKRAIHMNAKVVWADRAVVYEWLPPSKVNYRWILQRALRTAQTETYVDFALEGTLVARARRAILASVRILAGGIMLIPWTLYGILRGKHIAIKPVRIIARGAGMMLAALGIYYREYSKTHHLFDLDD